MTGRRDFPDTAMCAFIAVLFSVFVLFSHGAGGIAAIRPQQCLRLFGHLLSSVSLQVFDAIELAPYLF